MRFGLGRRVDAAAGSPRRPVRRPVRLLLVALVGMLGATGVVVAAAPSPAQAYYVYPSTTWTEYGVTANVNGYANGDTYYCGLLACGEWNNVYAWVGRYSGVEVNLARVTASMAIHGIGVSVEVSTTGAGLGFFASGSQCSAGWWEGPQGASSTSVSFGSPAICQGSGVAITGGDYTTTGGVRVGSTWTARSATAA